MPGDTINLSPLDKLFLVLDEEAEEVAKLSIEEVDEELRKMGKEADSLTLPIAEAVLEATRELENPQKRERHAQSPATTPASSSNLVPLEKNQGEDKDNSTVGSTPTVPVCRPRVPKRRERELHTEINIAASPQEVWGALNDLAILSQSSTDIERKEEIPERSDRLVLPLQSAGLWGFVFWPKLLTIELYREIRWLNQCVTPKICENEHALFIEPRGTHQVRVVQRERLTGILASVFARAFYAGRRRNLENMNYALKLWAEGRSANGRNAEHATTC